MTVTGSKPVTHSIAKQLTIYINAFVTNIIAILKVSQWFKSASESEDFLAAGFALPALSKTLSAPVREEREPVLLRRLYASTECRRESVIVTEEATVVNAILGRKLLGDFLSTFDFILHQQ